MPGNLLRSTLENISSFFFSQNKPVIIARDRWTILHTTYELVDLRLNYVNYALLCGRSYRISMTPNEAVLVEIAV